MFAHLWLIGGIIRVIIFIEMFCKQCGKPVSKEAKFCGNCGTSLVPGNVITQTDVSNLVAKAVSQPISNVDYNSRFSHKSILKKLLVLIGGLVVISILLTIFLGQLGVTLVNWLLGIIFMIIVLALPIGIILMTVFLLKKDPTNLSHEQYLHRQGVWAAIGPLMVLISVVFCYIIVQIISNFNSN